MILEFRWNFGLTEVNSTIPSNSKGKGFHVYLWCSFTPSPHPFLFIIFWFWTLAPFHISLPRDFASLSSESTFSSHNLKLWLLLWLQEKPSYCPTCTFRKHSVGHEAFSSYKNGRARMLLLRSYRVSPEATNILIRLFNELTRQAIFFHKWQANQL